MSEPTITIPLSMLGEAENLTAEAISRALSAKVIENERLSRQADFIVHLINTNKLFAQALQNIIDDPNKTSFSQASALRELMSETTKIAEELRQSYESGKY